ncbi:MAG: hypothetical protein GY945_10275 [Rhodobacteraceae bacterium]|nr:hypothetical protein [Paracoccaceae bacterium]
MDRNEFENWLREQSRETCVKIAARAALRVFPFVTHIDQTTDREKQLALLTARAILTSGVAAVSPTPEVIDAAYAAAADAAAADATDAAAYEDTIMEPGKLFETPLWHDAGQPQELVQALQGKPDLLERPEWSFWRDWYQGFLDGNPMNWDLQREVALIPDEDWEKGPEHIAGLIEGIRKNYDRKPLDHAQVKEQAKRLVAQPETTALIASSVADQIDEAMEQYFADANVNQLPEALEPLPHLPPILRQIAASSQSDEKIAELEAQIKELVATVQALNAALAKEKGKSRWQRAGDTAFETSIKLATTAFWGSIAAGVSHATGIVDVGNLLERLSSVAPEIPQFIEVPQAPIKPPIDI